MKLFSVKGFNFLFKNPQLVYGVVLLILIPAALVINTVFLIKNTEQVMDVELQRKASLANSLFSVNVPQLLADSNEMQRLIERTAADNSEIHSLDVLIPDGDDFKIVASLDKQAIGGVSKYIYNTIAWRTEDTIAFLTTSQALSTEDQTQQSEDRFWVVVKSVYDDSDEKVAVVSMKMSSKIVDDLTRKNINQSFIILLGTVVVVILLLVNNMRLFQYALLFKKLKEVDEMKDEFISVASHELRAPITGIRGYLQMTLDNAFGELPKEVEEKLKLVLKQSDNLNDLVADLLDVSRIEQGRVKLSLQPVMASLAIEGVVKSFRQQAKNKKLELRTIIPPDLPPIYVDEKKFRQILTNLLSNSIKYTFKGGITVSAELKREKEAMIHIKIKDTGIGMLAKDRERLFEKFYRVKSKDTDAVAGTGLGLWITKKLITLMKGEIYVDSIENTGTEVTVVFPIHQDVEKK